ncbi:protein PALS2 [Patella vulgata]|uniref:protein PALS2 n=1 Tax=Patella vulgata TaxID=6465 RepID=UPI00217FF03B|nr:protein PALS2 [Patella vulgata]
MPAAARDDISGTDALQTLQNGFDVLEDREVNAEDDDLDFLKSFLDDPAVAALFKIHDELENGPPEPEASNSVGMARDVLSTVASAKDKNRNAASLSKIIKNPHFKALLVAHDDVVQRDYGDQLQETVSLMSPPPPVFNVITEQVRFVTIRKSDREPLGITVKLDENDDLVVARILQGSLIDKQGLLRVNDIIREVNGLPMITPDQLMETIVQADNTITLKIVPSYGDSRVTETIYMKAHFNYDPMKDRLIPCKEAGLPFQDGDILEIVNSDDSNWWQARFADIDGPTGLIPSKNLEEKRKAFVQHDYDNSSSSLFCGLTKKKKKKYKYNTKANTDFDRCDVLIYEEVRRMSPFQRSVLVLVGANGVGRRSLKERLIRDDPRRFSGVIAHTSRAPRENESDGKGYFFTDRETMAADINNNKYIEFGEYNGNLYGTKLEKIYEVKQSGKMCVLDVNPTSLKILKTPEFMPYIVFIAAPSVEVLKVMYEEGHRLSTTGRAKNRGGGPNFVETKTEEDFIRTVRESAQIEQTYKAYFDLILVNDSFEQTYRSLRKALTSLTSTQQWVPVNWVY